MEARYGLKMDVSTIATISEREGLRLPPQYEDLRERIRDVRQGPDGALYLVTDSSSGRVLRLVPAK